MILQNTEDLLAAERESNVALKKLVKRLESEIRRLEGIIDWHECRDFARANPKQYKNCKENPLLRHYCVY